MKAYKSILSELKIGRGPKYPPIYQQIIDQIRILIGQGKLSPGDQLPTIKELYQHFQVNPNTVARSYMELERIGILQGHRGGGTRVCSLTPISQQEKKAKLKEIIIRVLAEVSQYGLTSKDLIQEIIQANH